MRTAAEDQVPADRAAFGELYPTAAQKQILQIEKAYPGQGICLADVIVYAFREILVDGSFYKVPA